MTEDTRTMPDGDEVPAKTTRGRSALLFFRDLLVIFVVAVLVSFLIKTFLIRSFFIPSQSMEQTLEIDDRIIVNQLVPDLTPLEHGDVVVFKDPGGWLTPRADPRAAAARRGRRLVPRVRRPLGARLERPSREARHRPARRPRRVLQCARPDERQRHPARRALRDPPAQ